MELVRITDSVEPIVRIVYHVNGVTSPDNGHRVKQRAEDRCISVGIECLYSSNRKVQSALKAAPVAQVSIPRHVGI